MYFTEDYTIAAYLLPRLLGLIYFFAFGAFIFQMRGLLGSDGILPVDNFLRWVKKKFPKKCYWLIPSVFWINASNAALMTIVLLGTLLSIVLMLGFYSSLCLLLLYILYLSIVSTGQDFLSFGWEGFFLEITLNTFLVSLTTPPNIFAWASLNLLLFRFFFQAGAVKLQSQDPNWRNLTAIYYHYQSQPIPNMVAWYVHKLPIWFHKLSTEMMFIGELFVPFFIFGPETLRLVAFFAFMGMLGSIWITGNFSYLNHLSAVFCIILVSNNYLSSWLTPPPASLPSLPLQIFCSLAGATLLVLQIMQLWHHFFYNRKIAAWLYALHPFYIVNRYGIFAIMTTVRNEIVFEGSDDGIEWKEYLFYYKPSEVTRRPRRIAPYQPRIDWQAWFLPLGGYRFDPWYESFLYHLLKGTPSVLALLRFNPFPDHPPRFVRALMYEYQFSSREEKKEQGIWWRRKYVGLFTAPVTLKNP